MPPKKHKAAEKSANDAHGRKSIRSTTVKHGKGKGKHGKKNKPGTPQKDEIDDLFPSIENRFPLDPGETIVNPDHETSYYHLNHENSDISAIDFRCDLYNLPLVIGTRGQSTVHAGLHGIIGHHDTIPHAQHEMEPGVIGWVPVGEEVKKEEVRTEERSERDERRI